MRIASGSAAELEVLLELAADIYGVTDESVIETLDHVGRQLTVLTRMVAAARSK